MVKKRRRDPKPTKQNLLATFSQSSAPSLIKHLASTNPSVRSLSLRLLESWLTTTAAAAATSSTTSVESETNPPNGLVSDDEMKKLWKGLFYCLWHCDKAVPQANLIHKLSALLVSLDPPLGLQYFENFLLTLRREWTGIDHLRLDKFYLLIRKFVKSMFVFLRNYKWDLGYLERFVGILINKAFLADDKLLGNGVCYHISSVFLDELRGCSVCVEKEFVHMLFKPFFSVLSSSLDKVLVWKVKNCVFEELLNSGRSLLEVKKDGVIDEGKVGYDDLAYGVIAMNMGFAGKLYEVGSSSDCVQGNRKVIFRLHEEFLKLEKEFILSGIDINLEAENGNEEIPELIPIENGDKSKMDANGSLVAVNGELEKREDAVEDDEKLRKSKKAKKGSKGNDNKTKKKKNGKKVKALDGQGSDVISANTAEDGNLINSNGDNTCNESESDGLLSESVIANLQLQFEKVAAELGSDEDDTDLSNALITRNNCKSPKKRKRSKVADGEDLGSLELSNKGNGILNTGKSSDKSGKKVRFAMKNNLVWQPQSPLPPQSLRLPPSATPRGSALKKGVPPGPVREIPPAKKKLKQKKKGRKILKTISPALRRLQKL